MKVLCMSLLTAAVASAAGPAIKCEDLATRSFGKEVTIRSAALVVTKGNLPEHCDVRGVIWPEAQFAIKLPTVWNDRFEMVGNGGTAGTISMGAVDGAQASHRLSASRLRWAQVSCCTRRSSK